MLYSAFCVTTARPLAGTPAPQTAQSEQRQDTGVTAGLLRADWGSALLVVAGLLVVAAGLEAARRACGSTSGSGSRPGTRPGRWLS